MAAETENGTATADALRLRSEIGHLKKLLEQREMALASLNRRLMTLERTDARATDERLAGLMEQIAMHEQTVAHLQRQLEQAHEGQAAHAESAARSRQQADESAARIQELTEEIDRLYATRLFRYASPLRKIYGRLRSS